MIVKHSQLPDPTQSGSSGTNGAVDKRNVEQIYPLRPMQHALHWQCMASAGVDPGFLQVRFSLIGELDPDRFERAWNRVMRRHASLRMAILPRRDESPLLVVLRDQPLPMTYVDARGSTDDDPKHAVDQYCASDREQGFELSRPPVMRLAVFQTDDNVHQIVWSCHHLFLDGWSAAIVINEVLGSYLLTADPDAPELAPLACTYRDYYSWLKDQDTTTHQSFWRDYLGGYSEPIRLTDVNSSADDSVADQIWERVDVTLGRELSDAIEAASATHQLTANCIVQGAWAILLSAVCQRKDVVFGSTVSGRNVPLPGIESLVGFVSNVVPVRAVVDPDVSVSQWLRGIRDDQFHRQPHEHVSLAEIQEWSDVQGSTSFFDSLVVVENFPLLDLTSAPGGLRLQGFESGITTTYPMTLVAAPGEVWILHGIFDGRRLPPDRVEEWMEHLPRLIEQLLAGLDDTMKDIVAETLKTIRPARRTLTEPASHQLDTWRQSDQNHVAPRNAHELAITKIWESVLGVHPIGMRDGFFSVGGRSIAAVRIVSRIEEQFGKKIPLSWFVDDPTIEMMAERLQTEPESTVWRSLVPLRTSGSKTPLFLTHALGGHVLFYRDLVRCLDSQRPVYALEPVGLDGKSLPIISLAEMAQHYISEIRSVQPTGPYHLLGHCAGGVLCFEMAQQLRRDGQEVGLVGILDVNAPPLREGDDPRSTSAVLNRAASKLMSGQIHGMVRELLHLRPVSAVTWTIKRAYHRRYPPRNHAARLHRVTMTTKKAVLEYFADRYDDSITLFLSVDTKVRIEGWQELAREVQCCRLSAGHQEILIEPAVHHSAKVVDECLESLESPTEH